MKIPSCIQVCVLDGRGIVPELAGWLRDVPDAWYATKLPGVPAEPTKDWWLNGHARNLIAAHFLAESEHGYLLLVDDDQVPTEKCDETLRCEAPVVGARYWSRWGGHCHGTGSGVVGCGFLKVSREVLAAIGPDPFAPGEKECECMAFGRRCRDAGFLPIHVGAIGHYCQVIVMPDGEDGYLIKGPARPTGGR